MRCTSLEQILPDMVRQTREGFLPAAQSKKT
jgi:hypothetical protein